MDTAGRSKMLYSMINTAEEGGEVNGGATTEATMNFEDMSTKAVGEGQVKQLLAAYAAYASMGSTDETTGEQMDTHLKNAVHSFSRTEVMEDVLVRKLGRRWM